MRKLIALTSLACVALATQAGAALRIEITEGVQGARPIAIVPFGVEPGVALDVDLAAVVAQDLKRTGLFKPLPVKQMLETPTDPRAVDYANWRQVGVDNVVVGSIAANGRGDYRISFDILDVYAGRALTGYQITAEAGELRDAAHAVANLIYEQFTGEPGYFLSSIAYITAQRDGNRRQYRLVVSDYDGHNPQTVLASHDPIMSPAWNPAGTKLAYVAFQVDRGRTSLQVQDLATGEVTKISSRQGINGAPAWSPNGQKLAMTLSFEGDPDIYVYNLNSGNLERMTTSPAIDTQPTWSPDGAYIAFTSDRGGHPQIYRMRSGGGGAERVTFAGESNQDADYSPDGEKLTLVQGGDNGFRIAVLDLKSNNVRIVSDGPLDESPNFAPNGQTIIFARQGKEAELATVSVDGRVKARLRQAGQVREPVWGPLVY